jgi:hypothetical protein
MALEELSPTWIALFSVFITATTVGIIPGVRYFYNRYKAGLDRRIDSCTQKALDPFKQLIADYKEKLDKIHQRLDDYENFFFEGRKR